MRQHLQDLMLAAAAGFLAAHLLDWAAHDFPVRPVQDSQLVAAAEAGR